ncbi:hypothetical protein SNEBB_011083 [Seison nebaliae]|nr:hypothetical protein SNEBB_011083 [Seison nebaliae]
MTSTTKRKIVYDEVINKEFDLDESEHSIKRVLKSCGNNLHEVEDEYGNVCLMSMPVKFRKVIWIKRHDYVITLPIDDGEKVKCELVNILTRNHVERLINENRWPQYFKGKLNWKIKQKDDFDPTKLIPSSSESDSDN